MKFFSLILITTITVLFISASCHTSENYNLKMTIVPEGSINEFSHESLADATTIIRNRLIKFGLTDENITTEVLSDKILIAINGIDTNQVEVLKRVVTTPGELGFWETYENSEVIQYLVEANDKLKSFDPGIDISPVRIHVGDTVTNLLESDDQPDSASISNRRIFDSENPLFAILMPRVDYEGKPVPSCLIGLSFADDTAKVNAVFSNYEVSLLFPRDIKFLWSMNPYEYDETGKLYELHAIRITTRDNKAPLNGDAIVSSSVNIKGEDIRLRLTMDTENAMLWKRMTRDNIDRCIAIVIDGKVVSYPRVIGEITEGNTEITGNFTLEEAQSLAVILNSGGEILPLKLMIVDLKTEKME